MFITTKKHNEMLQALEERLAAAITSTSTAYEATATELGAAIEAKLRADVQSMFEVALAADRSKRYDSSEPFVEIVSETFSEEGGVQLRLDWNAPFITYLKRNGFTGPTDEAIVDNWLISLSRERIAEGGSEFK